MIRRVVLASLAILSVAAVAQAQPDWALGTAGQPLQVRMEGYFGPAPAGVNPQATWKLDVEGKQYPFALTNLLVIDGNALPGDIISGVAPFPIAFDVAGTKEAMSVVKAASPTTKVSLLGAIDASGPVPIFMMSKAEALGAPTPSK